ncbi:MAG TPA: hypothetical protein VEL28_11605 [Candidatus Binatia bacterium]|nr:hypothetical protein [Candidatus Binatia bacterium]
MIGLLLTLVLVAALTASGYRWQRRLRFRRALAALPGGSEPTAIEVDGFGDIDFHLQQRICPCGGRVQSLGERSAPAGQRVLRVVRVECRSCETISEVWFDASRAYH